MNFDTCAGWPALLKLVRLLSRGAKVMVVGPPGSGKSTLVAEAAARVRRVAVLSADPGQPLAGPPCAVSLAVPATGFGAHTNRRLLVLDVEPVGSLDALLFRLPLVEAARTLVKNSAWRGPLVVDAPGVWRGAAAGELLAGMASAVGATHVLAVLPGGAHKGPLAYLEGTGLPLEVVSSHPKARLLPHAERVQKRTHAWLTWLRRPSRVTVDLSSMSVVLWDKEADIAGRVAILVGRSGRSLFMGYVDLVREGGKVELVGRWLREGNPRLMLVRDAGVDGSGRLVTLRKRMMRPKVPSTPPRWDRPISLPKPPASAEGSMRWRLLGGLVGDPLLLGWEARTSRMVMVDAGEHPKLLPRVARRTTHLFLSHAHMDHVAGLPWFVRRRIGEERECTVWGPVGMAERIHHLLSFVWWDPSVAEAPRLLVCELDPPAARLFSVKAGEKAPALVRETSWREGDELPWCGPNPVAKAVLLDHGIPVAAYRFVEAGGRSVVYATDLADTEENRNSLVRLAKEADVLVLEAAFSRNDEELARATRHLTTKACAEIARAASVSVLVPFHISPRYKGDIPRIIEELREVFPALWLGGKEKVKGSVA